MMLILAGAADAIAAVPPKPSNDPASWVSNADYPPAALRSGAEGVVGFTLQINEQGQVVGCHITLTSKSELLDTQTCALMMQRAVFTPAHYTNGKTFKGEFSSRVRWAIPAMAPMLPVVGTVAEPYRIVIKVEIDAKGTVAGCRTIEPVNVREGTGFCSIFINAPPIAP